ncbi:P-loop NTPase fold protein [Egbenema bharatensis]|uniref:P-loop NTPase fold protein n=1 Tax=Egbenema bharatensis TaxID=3463334 RepID=UPI003A88D7EB
MPASLLERFRQAYRDLDLFPLLSAQQIEDFRVDYGQDTLARLEQAIDDADQDGKLIFSGHRGCGKSTLLARFGREMMQQGYFVVFFSIAEMVEMSAVDHINILYAIAVQLLSKATERQVPIPPKEKDAILTWLATTRTETTSRSLTGEAGIGGDILKLVTAKLKTESTFREEIKRTYERRISELVEKVETIAKCVRDATKKEVLVIIDDLDKLDLKLVEEIYKKNINALFQPKIRIVFTIPIAVIRDIELRTILQTASGSPIQQMEVVKFFSRENRHRSGAVPEESKVRLLLEVLQRRIESDLIEPDTAHELILSSGGVMRELVRIARACCSQCLLLLRREPERTEIKITDEILELALRDLRNDFAASLGTSRYQILATTYHHGEPEEVNDPEFLLLLHGLYVLEYRNGDLWYDVHPMLLELLKRRNLIETESEQDG